MKYLSFSVKKMAIAGAIFCGFTYFPVHAVEVSFTQSGTINFGKDYLGIFGAAGADLTGQSFTQTIMGNTDGLQEMPYGSNWNFLETNGTSVTFTGLVSVGGKSYSWTVDNADASIYLLNYVSTGVSFGPDEAGISLTGAQNITRDGTSLNVVNSLLSYNAPVVSSLNMGQKTTFNLMQPNVNAYTIFQANRNGGQSFFDGTATTSQWNVSAVPESEEWALLLGGLAFLSVVARRKKNLS